MNLHGIRVRHWAHKLFKLKPLRLLLCMHVQFHSVIVGQPSMCVAMLTVLSAGRNIGNFILGVLESSFIFFHSVYIRHDL